MRTKNRTDEEIQQAVQDELRRHTHLQPYDLHASVTNGVVTLTGQVDLHTQRLAAQILTHRFHDVQAVVNAIKVRSPQIVERSDAEIETEVIEALHHMMSPVNRLEIAVNDGTVTLRGEVDTGLQKRDVAWAIHRLAGIKGIDNRIMVRYHLWPTDLKQTVEKALIRNAQDDADHITVEVQGNKVILNGVVQSYIEKQVAEDAIWSTPGVSQVDNNLVITHTL